MLDTKPLLGPFGFRDLARLGFCGFGVEAADSVVPTVWGLGCSGFWFRVLQARSAQKYNRQLHHVLIEVFSCAGRRENNTARCEASTILRL